MFMAKLILTLPILAFKKNCILELKKFYPRIYNSLRKWFKDALTPFLSQKCEKVYH